MAGDRCEEEPRGYIRERPDGRQGRMDQSDDRVEDRPILGRETDIRVYRQMVRASGTAVLFPLNLGCNTYNIYE